MPGKIRKILLLNGPNLNLLGSRETDIYGKTDLAKIEKSCMAAAKKLDMQLQCRQSNHEGELIDYVQSAGSDFDAIIINPAAYSHTSVALVDALKAFGKPIMEVHLSNIHKREEFRHHSYVSALADGVICGLGPYGYIAAIHALADMQ